MSKFHRMTMEYVESMLTKAYDECSADMNVDDRTGNKRKLIEPAMNWLLQYELKKKPIQKKSTQEKIGECKQKEGSVEKLSVVLFDDLTRSSTGYSSKYVLSIQKPVDLLTINQKIEQLIFDALMEFIVQGDIDVRGDLTEICTQISSLQTGLTCADVEIFILKIKSDENKWTSHVDLGNKYIMLTVGEE